MKRPTGSQIFAGAVILAVAVVVVIGLVLSGSPQLERARRLDSQRIQDLEQLSYAVDNFWNFNKKLPATLDQLPKGGGFPASIVDPKTQTPYEYRVVTATTYELCAIFETADNSQIQPAPPYPVAEYRNWQHDIGRTCFRLNVPYPPTPVKIP